MEDKKELVKSLNIDNYLDFHSKIYECIPYELLEAESLAKEEIFKEYERSKESVLNGTKKRKLKRRHELTPEQKEDLERYRDLEKWVELMAIAGNPIIDLGEFLTLKTIVNNYVLELDPINKALERKIVDKETILSSKLSEYLELIDLDLLVLAVNQEYIPKKRLLDAARTFCNVKVCQWINSMFTGNAKDEKAKNQPIDSGFKIEWKGDRKALYYLFNELKAKGLIEDYNNTELARILKSCFEGFESAKDGTIAQQLSRLVEPARNGQKRKIDTIVGDTLKVSKSKK